MIGARAALWAVLLAAAAGSNSCSKPSSPSAPVRRWLEITQVRPVERAEVFLNERLVFHFSEALDPASVHGASVRIVASDGRAARGQWHVVADRIEFTPAAVLSPDLGDGGFRPGAEYTAQLLGFPSPDGLRGRSGAPLRASNSWTFRVVSTAERGERPLFEDSSPTRGLPLVLVTAVLSEGDPILLSGEEPVDPSSLDGDDFELIKRSNNGAIARSAPIPLAARLVQNEDKRAGFPPGGTRIELAPRDTPLEPGAYVLRMAREGRVNDLGGHAMMLVSPTSTRLLDVRVEAGRRSARGGLVSHLESFAHPSTRSGEAWDGADGAAWWRDSGRVEMRVPRMVGGGGHGECGLHGALDFEDLHATRIRLEADHSATLVRPSGLVLLRSQTSVRIAGRLTRARATSEEARECEVEWLAALESAPIDAEVALDRLAREGVAATVIVAGGDLVIEGRLELPGPLILIAGGRIRVSRQALLETQRLWFLDLATESIAHHIGGHRVGAGERLAWTLAPLERNVLRTPLRLAALSVSIPPGGAQRFEFGPRVTAWHGAGRARVRYVGDRPVGAASRTSVSPVDDPALLMGHSTLRLLIELEVFPSADPTAPWDPPWVDDVLLEYEPAGSGVR